MVSMLSLEPPRGAGSASSTAVVRLRTGRDLNELRARIERLL